ncbi:hypothetical protein CY0110_16042 [Crocosphaera chwakensis CCY0110]|uniref:Uncharacterized protein n=1 Tax=Crocosphaera chwakensis CCY0110 TaxID=391612 RepID=A3IHP0_9CHRO|nr:hypothetical protein CY0110_16042 [Crocosphaera chwakensis CCY0110]
MVRPFICRKNKLFRSFFLTFIVRMKPLLKRQWDREY